MTRRSFSWPATDVTDCGPVLDPRRRCRVVKERHLLDFRVVGWIAHENGLWQ